MNRWKHELYEKAQIGIPHGDTEANNLVIFGFMMAQFIADFRWQLSRRFEDNEEDKSPHVSFKRFSSLRPFSFEFFKVVAHFHEWMAGIGLMMLGLWKVEVVKAILDVTIK